MSGSPPTTSAKGELFLYTDAGLAAFEFGSGEGHRAVVCIPGLTDGLLSLRYSPALAEAVRSVGWRVVQPVLSSSYKGWGVGSLAEDVDEIDALLSFIQENRCITEVVLLGHSTGCQDVVAYLRTGKRASSVRAAVLQAACSDREALVATDADLGEVTSYQAKAAQMLASGNGLEVMPRAASLLFGVPHPVTAYRFHSLVGRMTDDDMFSSDLTDEELVERLGHVVVPTLIALSADDEYVPQSVNVPAHATRMARSMASGVMCRAETVVLSTGGHAASSVAGTTELVAAIVGFLQQLDAIPAEPTRQLAEVASMLRARAAEKNAGEPLLVALAGMPGAGKSTTGAALAKCLGELSFVVPVDGYHLPLARLRQFPDADAAVYRRGAPDTFDPASLHRTLASLRSTGPKEVLFPGFDHAVGDPVLDAWRFDRNKHKIVVAEGLYLLHECDGWEGIAELFDLRIYLDADEDECIARVRERNSVIPGYTVEEMTVRVEEVDRVNARIVEKSRARADVVLRSAAPRPENV